MSEKNYNLSVRFTYKIVWIGEHRVGVVYEPKSLGIDFNIHAHLLGEMMDVEHLLHLDPENIWNTWSKYDDKYFPILGVFVADYDYDIFHKKIFKEAKEIFNEVKYLQDNDRLPEEARNTVRMMETLIENLIARNPTTIESEEIEIIENKIKEYMKGYLDNN